MKRCCHVDIDYFFYFHAFMLVDADVMLRYFSELSAFSAFAFFLRDATGRRRMILR